MTPGYTRRTPKWLSTTVHSTWRRKIIFVGACNVYVRTGAARNSAYLQQTTFEGFIVGRSCRQRQPYFSAETGSKGKWWTRLQFVDLADDFYKLGYCNSAQVNGPVCSRPPGVPVVCAQPYQRVHAIVCVQHHMHSLPSWLLPQSSCAKLVQHHCSKQIGRLPCLLQCTARALFAPPVQLIYLSSRKKLHGRVSIRPPRSVSSSSVSGLSLD